MSQQLPRDVLQVIDRVVALVPAEEVKLLNRLKSARDTAEYCAPEVRTSRGFALLCSILTEELPSTPREPWQDKIGRIVRAEE